MCQPIETKRVGVDIDIYDDRYHWVGKADKHKAHQEGLWHRVFTCLLVIPKQRTVLLQKKNTRRLSFQPSRLSRHLCWWTLFSWRIN
jgi:hypothetical protein